MRSFFSKHIFFASSSELSEFTKDTGRFLHSTDHCDDEDGSSDSPDVDISGPNILQIFFAMLTFLFMFFLTTSCDRCLVTDIIFPIRDPQYVKLCCARLFTAAISLIPLQSFFLRNKLHKSCWFIYSNYLFTFANCFVGGSR